MKIIPMGQEFALPCRLVNKPMAEAFLSKGEWISLADWRVLKLAETASTNTDAKELAGELAGELAVWAIKQNAGRGREDRQRQSSPMSSLTFSLLFRPNQAELDNISRFTALGALSLVDLLEHEYQIKAQVKWPNDVLIDSKKISGVLLETIWSGSQPEALVLGIGVNLKNSAFGNENELRFPASSLEAAGIVVEDLSQFLEKLIEKINMRRKLLGSQKFIDDWNASLAFKGVFMPIKQYQGKTEMLCPESINPDGSLNTRDQAGMLRIIQSAEFSAPL